MEDILYEQLKTVCQNRCSTRRFSERQVPASYIAKILEIAQTAPFASGRKNWEILVVTDRKQILAAASAIDERAQALGKLVRRDFQDNWQSYAQSFSFFTDAPVLLLPVFRISPALSALAHDPSLAEWERDNFTKSISCAAMLILLAAESLGLGACYMTGPLLAEKELAKIFKVRPGRQLGAVIPIGYAIQKGADE
jgi:nitroreductase